MKRWPIYLLCAVSGAVGLGIGAIRVEYGRTAAMVAVCVFVVVTIEVAMRWVDWMSGR